MTRRSPARRGLKGCRRGETNELIDALEDLMEYVIHGAGRYLTGSGEFFSEPGDAFERGHALLMRINGPTSRKRK